MFSFIKRFLLAWRLASNPDALKTLWSEVKLRESEEQIRSYACRNAKVAIIELVPEDRHSRRKDLDVTLQFECATIMTPDEADKILEESRTENKPRLSDTVWATPLGSQIALDKHDEQRLKKLS